MTGVTRCGQCDWTFLNVDSETLTTQEVALDVHMVTVHGAAAIVPPKMPD